MMEVWDPKDEITVFSQIKSSRFKGLGGMFVPG